MEKIILKAENLGKQYRLGVVGARTIKHDFNRFLAKVLGKEDPYLHIGSTNDRTSKIKTNYVWALKDINFQVSEGEVLGIIGKNGAGKSTLLKILSRVTSPTKGVIKTRGRIASLLEVGTGFHPELTGRENIYLNGAILGMGKAEIRAKEEEIIDFSGCAMYIDTPVKRYSSGMRVRLAFAVAAHLEPDILVVDEVLAVGDAEFQKKAVGKMQDISQGGGRTVLFVSHNMSTINSLCTRTILLENGKILMDGLTSEVVPFYLTNATDKSVIPEAYFAIDEKHKFQLTCAILLDKDLNPRTNGTYLTTEPIRIKIEYFFSTVIYKCHLTLMLKNSSGEVCLLIDRSDFYRAYFVAKEGKYQTIINLQNPLLKPGAYTVSFGLSDKYTNTDNHQLEALKFVIQDLESIRDSRPGQLYLPTEWEMKKS